MKNEENENNYREIRVFLIGDYYVGKRSIANRFQILNSNLTTKDYSNALPVKQKTSKEAEGKIKPKEEQHELSYEEKELLHKQQKIRDLMAVGKVFTIGYHTLTFNFFPISEAIPLNVENEMKEEDDNYAFEKEYQITLKHTKSEIDLFMRRPSKNPKAELDFVFLFIYDLKDHTSFEKIQIYYRELNKQFLLSANYACALIGNKLDIKPQYGDTEKKAIAAFVAANNLKHYEISTLIFFNFENFFETLFNDLLSGFTEDFSNENFKKRLHLMLTFRPSFPKAKRITFESNENPSPADYNSDIYAYSDSKEEMKSVFSNKTRFTNHIFINKQGPIFPHIVETGYEKTQHKTKEGGFNIMRQWDNQMSSEVKDILETLKPGYSLGLVKGKLNLKNERKEQRQQRFEALHNAIDDDAKKLTQKIVPRMKDQEEYDKYDSNRRENYSRKAKEVKRIELEGKSKRIKVTEMNEYNQEQKLKQLKEKDQAYSEKKEMRDQDLLNHKMKASLKISTSLKPNQSSTPGTQYDIRGKIDLTKGFTFGSKYTFDENKVRDNPEFSNLKSDFDVIVERECKKTGKRHFAERFQTPSYPEPKEPTDIMSKWKRWEQAKKANKQKNPFFETRKELQKVVNDNKRVIISQKELELEAKIEQQKRRNNLEDINIPNINYTQVEEQSPLFTMKGRYDIGGIFSSIAQEKKNDYGDLNNQLANDLTKAALPLPKFNAVKPNLPSFSFTKADRFDNTLSRDFVSTNRSEMVFSDGIFVPDDRKTFSILQATMGKSKKDNELKASWIPGPGYYKIKGFAEDVVCNGMKINEARTKIRNEQKEKQKAKQKDEGKASANDKEVVGNEEFQQEEQQEEEEGRSNEQTERENEANENEVIELVAHDDN